MLPQEPKQEATETPSKTYLKAMPLKELTDIENVKNEVKNGNIIILRVTPLANKSIEEVKTAVNQLYEFTESVGGDIARLGEERVVICPKNIRIWREKTPTPTSSFQPDLAYSSLKVSSIAGTTVFMPALLSKKLAKFMVFCFSPWTTKIRSGLGVR